MPALPGRTLRVRPTAADDAAPPRPRNLTVEKAGIRLCDCIDICFEAPQALARTGDGVTHGVQEGVCAG